MKVLLRIGLVKGYYSHIHEEPWIDRQLAKLGYQRVSQVAKSLCLVEDKPNQPNKEQVEE